MSTFNRSKPMFRRELVVPGVSRRGDFTIDPERCALLVIDIQRYLCPSLSSLSNNGNKAETLSSSIQSTAPKPAAHHNEYSPYYLERFPSVVAHISQLTQAFRAVRDATPPPPAISEASSSNSQYPCNCEVIFTFLQSCTVDGRDISLDYKLSGPLLANIPKMGEKDLFWPECAPNTTSGKGDILLPKTSCSVFQSTNLDYLLRNLCMDQLVVVGQMTDQCVESAVRDAADLGYQVVVVDDACLSNSPEAQQKGLMGMKGFCRILGTQELLQELNSNSKNYQRHPAASTNPAEAAVAASMIRKGAWDTLIVDYLSDIQGLDENVRNQVTQALLLHQQLPALSLSSSPSQKLQAAAAAAGPPTPPPPVSNPPHFHQA
jgi:nicotinamidase-related amidase